MARIFRKLAQLTDLDETAKVAGNVVAVNAGADGYELVTPSAGGGSSDAADVDFTPAGNLSSVNVQAALEELDSEKQPLDTDLTAIAALATTAFGRGLLILANQGALLAAAGAADAVHVHAGEDITSGTVADARIASTIARDTEVTAAIAALSTVYQPLDSDLSAVAALTTTSFGRGLLTLADAAALLSAAGAAAASHTHAESDVTNLTTDLAGKQPLDSDLTAIAALTPTNDDVVQRKSGAWTNRTLAQLISDLAALGTTFQPLDSDLTAVAGLSPSNDDIVQRKAGSWTNRTLAQLISDLAALGTTFQPLDADLTSIAALTTDAAGRSILTLTDPNADRIAFWDDSAGGYAHLTPGTGLTITGTTIDASSVPEDPVADVFGTPDTAFEFNTSSLTGLTAIGSTPDVEAAHTVIPGHYYVERRTNSGGIMGRYLAAPSTPWSAIAKVSDANIDADYNKVLMFIAADSAGVPGTLDLFSHGLAVRQIAIDRWSSPTAFSSGVATGLPYFTPPFYFAIKAASGTDYDFLISKTGRVWYPFVRTRNPSLTIAWLGIGVACESASHEVGAAFDFLRIWNSGKTFRGAQ